MAEEHSESTTQVLTHSQLYASCRFCGNSPHKCGWGRGRNCHGERILSIDWKRIYAGQSQQSNAWKKQDDARVLEESRRTSTGAALSFRMVCVRTSSVMLDHHHVPEGENCPSSEVSILLSTYCLCLLVQHNEPSAFGSSSELLTREDTEIV